MDTMTAEDRAMHYIRWHSTAYGAPAPMDEIAGQLHKKHGLTEAQSHDLLVSMRCAGLVGYTDGEFSAGWHEVPHNVAIEPPVLRSA